METLEKGNQSLSKREQIGAGFHLFIIARGFFCCCCLFKKKKAKELFVSENFRVKFFDFGGPQLTDMEEILDS